MLDDLEWAIGELKKNRASAGDLDTFEEKLCLRVQPIVKAMSAFEKIDLGDAIASELRWKLIAKTFKVLGALVKQKIAAPKPMQQYFIDTIELVRDLTGNLYLMLVCLSILCGA